MADMLHFPEDGGGVKLSQSSSPSVLIPHASHTSVFGAQLESRQPANSRFLRVINDIDSVSPAPFCFSRYL